MKVALLVPGGVDRSGTHRVIPCLLWLIERLAAEHEVHVFAARQEPEPGRWPLLGAWVHNAGRAPVRLRMLRQLVAEHRRGRFDVLHGIWASPGGVVAGVAGRALGVPVLLHLTGGDLTDLREIGFGARSHWRGRMWVRLATALASRITVPSAYLAGQARALGIAAERLPFGVALDRWPSRPPLRRRPGAVARLLHVGSLNRVKDQATLIDAAAALRDAGVRFRLDVIGEDTLGGTIQRRAAELGLLDDSEPVTTRCSPESRILNPESYRVRFHGYLPHAELRPWVEQADLLLVSSRHEADPIVLLEAAVAGVPAVGTAVGHFADWAPAAAAAVPVGDARALAAETARLLADEDQRLAMAERAQRLAIEEDADFTARRVNALYADLAAVPYAPPDAALTYPCSEA